MVMIADRPYCSVFKNIHPKVIEAIVELKKAGFWKNDVPMDDKVKAMRLWIQKVSTIYGFEPPKFYFVDDIRQYRQTGGGCYFPFQHEFYVFHKPSMMTFLHEFRHAMQYKIEGLKLYKGDVEEDARAWSHSAFKKALPKSYKKAIERGLFHHQ